jgi:hypothetical protein
MDVGVSDSEMNDTKIKDKWLADICEGNKVAAIMGALKDARQDERSKLKKAIVKEYDIAEDFCDNDAMAVIKQLLQRLFA